MEEYRRQQEEENKRYRDYIERRRKEVETKQAGVVNQLNQELVQKYTFKQKIEQLENQNKKIPKTLLNEIISRVPPSQPEKEINDINQILHHLSEK